MPFELCSWEHRFDDPLREYRTLYCAAEVVTCLREVLADLRPNVTARAEYAQWQLAAGVARGVLLVPSREVTASWREQHSLVKVTVDRDGPLPDLDDVELRQELERAHAGLLQEHGMDHLDIAEVRSKNRSVTQAISRDLYEQGSAGLTFSSNLDDGLCLVVMEGRATLEEVGDSVPLTVDLPELRQVCDEFGLLLRPYSP